LSAHVPARGPQARSWRRIHEKGIWRFANNHLKTLFILEKTCRLFSGTLR